MTSTMSFAPDGWVQLLLAGMAASGIGRVLPVTAPFWNHRRLAAPER